jgi:PadR family transcriptional regulator PadR
MAAELEIPPGTLELLILRALAGKPQHGLGISRRIELSTKGAFKVKPGSLFPALHRLEAEGYIAGSWGESENNRRARFYKVTRAGSGRLEAETKRWNRIVLAVARALS